MKTNIATRRAVLAGAAAIPLASAVPAAALPAADIVLDSDAELLEFEPQLDAIWRDWIAQTQIDRSGNVVLYGDERDDEPWSDIHGRLFPLCEKILTYRPRTMAGLRMVTKAVTLVAAERWDGVCMSDTAHHEGAFIEAVCAFAGVTPAPLVGGESVRR